MFQQFNVKLSNIRSQIESLVSNYKIRRDVVSKDELQLQIEKIINPDKVVLELAKLDAQKKQNTLFDVWDIFIAEKIKLNEYKPGTLTGFKLSRKYLFDYQEYSKNTIFLDNINVYFYNFLVAYLRQEKRLMNNSIGGIIKNLKTVLNYALDNEFTQNRDFQKKAAFKAFKEEADTLSLTEDEIAKIKEVSLKGKLNTARDLFLFQIETMLRLGDLMKIKFENLDFENEELRLWQEKTSKFLRIPLSKTCLCILEKFENQLPKMHKTSYNISIKSICKEAGITENFNKVIFIGNERIEKDYPKYQLISSHTARRTGITRLILKGLPPELVMKVSGHYDMKSFQKYVRIAQDKAVDLVRKALNGEL